MSPLKGRGVGAREGLRGRKGHSRWRERHVLKPGENAAYSGSCKELNVARAKEC